MGSIADNLRRIQERIARAAESVGRNASEITLVGVTKYVGIKEVHELVGAGCHNIGESRPQELWKKAEVLFQGAEALIPSVSEFHWHQIGHLQRNKVRRTLPLVSLVHSVDSERLLAVIDEVQAATTDPKPPINVLLEVNTSGESAKNGLALTDVEPLLAVASDYPHVAIRGLMTMAALEGGLGVAARNFARLRELRDELKLNAPDCVQLSELSMGMSADYEVAVREGATIVRIGSALWE
jgi:pyridoxal phosphate enzyme (YggS family)